jgi:hypothetical protein
MQKAVVSSILVVGILLVRAVIADAQQPTKIYKVGWLGARSPSAPTREVFRREIRALGYGLALAADDTPRVPTRFVRTTRVREYCRAKDNLVRDAC